MSGAAVIDSIDAFHICMNSEESRAFRSADDHVNFTSPRRDGL
jgi:hypothetical protein